MNKILRPGTVRVGNQFVNLFVRVHYADKTLCLTGVEGPSRYGYGNAAGGCGQVAGSLLSINTYGPGWVMESALRLHAVWSRWHRNNMCAGSPAQGKWLRDNPIKAVYPESHYDKACAALAAAGLNPDHNADGYRFGSKWLHEDVPEATLQWLSGLPDTDIIPAWA